MAQKFSEEIDNELQSDMEYMECVRPSGSWRDQNPLKLYKGPVSLNEQSGKIIEARYENSLSHNAFPPNILVNKKDTMSTQNHRRLERYHENKDWETPVPRIGKNNIPIPLNDGGKVSSYYL